MKGWGDGCVTNGSRSSTVSTAGGEDAFAHAIVPVGKDIHPDSVAAIHNSAQWIGRFHSGWEARLLLRMWNRQNQTEEINFILDVGTSDIEASIWTIDSEYMRVFNGNYRIVNGSIRMKDSLSQEVATTTKESREFLLACLVDGVLEREREHGLAGSLSTAAAMAAALGTEEQMRALMEQRRAKRMLSNRESVRRSRMHKKRHLDDLAALVSL
ncbi:hypothetical protein ZWY2020_034562 [Hordeum vulgare]|nr:hypothetical protein ZWY2020_034562 [Hordeum vulgare]